MVVISVCLSILEGFDRKKRGWISPRGVGDSACGFPSPIEFFDQVGLMFIAVNKGLLISHSILDGVARKPETRRALDRGPENWTPIVRKGGLLIFQSIRRF